MGNLTLKHYVEQSQDIGVTDGVRPIKHLHVKNVLNNKANYDTTTKEHSRD